MIKLIELYILTLIIYFSRTSGRAVGWRNSTNTKPKNVTAGPNFQESYWLRLKVKNRFCKLKIWTTQLKKITTNNMFKKTMRIPPGRKKLSNQNRFCNFTQSVIFAKSRRNRVQVACRNSPNEIVWTFFKYFLCV